MYVFFSYFSCFLFLTWNVTINLILAYYLFFLSLIAKNDSQHLTQLWRKDGGLSYILPAHLVDMRSLFLAWHQRRARCHVSAGQHPMFHGRWLAPWCPQCQPDRCYPNRHVIRPTQHTGLDAVQGNPEQLGGDDITRLCILELEAWWMSYESGSDDRLRSDHQDHVPQRWHIRWADTLS